MIYAQMFCVNGIWFKLGSTQIRGSALGQKDKIHN